MKIISVIFDVFIFIVLLAIPNRVRSSMDSIGMLDEIVGSFIGALILIILIYLVGPFIGYMAFILIN